MLWAAPAGAGDTPRGAGGAAAEPGATPPVPCGVDLADLARTGERFAVLASVNEYEVVPDVPTLSSLRGADNDMDRLCRNLVDRFAFPPDAVARMRGPQTTRAGMLAALDALTARSAEGRVLVFGYAGHGSQVEDDTDEEPDGFDETLCPWDRSRRGDVRDDELRAGLGAMLERGAHVVTVIDSCHSGSSTRGAAGDEDIVFRTGIPSPVIPPTVDGAGDGGDLLGDLARDQRLTVLSAAADRQKAAEATVRLSTGRAYHGMFSHAVNAALEEAQPGATWGQLVPRIRDLMGRRIHQQDPLVAGNTRLKLFDVHEAPARPHFVVETVSGTTIRVAAAKAAGLDVGAILAVYSPDSERLVGKDGLVGLYQVTGRTGRSATASLSQEGPEGPEGQGTPKAGWPVVVLMPADALQRRSVKLHDSVPAAARACLVAELEGTPLVSVGDRDDGLLVYVPPAHPGCYAIAGGPTPWPADLSEEPQLACAGARWDGGCESLRPVAETVEKMAAWERFRGIRNPHSGSFVAADVLAIDLTPRSGEPRPAHAETGDPVFALGDVVDVSVRNTGPEPLFLSVTYLANDAGIWPMKVDNSLSQAVAPGGVFRAGGLRLARPCGTDHVLVVATRRRAFDPRPFAQEGARATLRSTRGGDPLAWWSKPMLGATRGGAPEDADLDEEWSTLLRPFRIVGCAEGEAK